MLWGTLTLVRYPTIHPTCPNVTRRNRSHLRLAAKNSLNRPKDCAENLYN